MYSCQQLLNDKSVKVSPGGDNSFLRSEFKRTTAIPCQGPHNTRPLRSSSHNSQEGPPPVPDAAQLLCSERLGAHGDGTGQPLPARNQTINQSAKSGGAVQSPAKNCHLFSHSATPSFTIINVLMWPVQEQNKGARN